MLNRTFFLFFFVIFFLVQLLWYFTSIKNKCKQEKRKVSNLGKHRIQCYGKPSLESEDRKVTEMSCLFSNAYTIPPRKLHFTLRLVIERSWVQIPAEAAGELSCPGSTFCADSYFGIRSIAVLPQ